MRTILIPILFLISFVSFFSCSKHRGDIAGVTPSSTVTVFSPAPNFVIHYGDSLEINAMAIAQNVMHGYDLKITRRNDTTALFFYHGHQHNDTLSIKGKWGNTIDTNTDLVLSVLVHLDHDGHTNEKKVAFKVE